MHIQKITGVLLILLATLVARPNARLAAQEKSAANDAKAERLPGSEYSGMYAFLKEGEFAQVTVEDAGRVTGFVSRYGDLDSDKGAFLDQFFKTGKLDGNALTFTTEVVHGISFEFKGTIERGEGKKPGDEGYYVLKGTLTETATDANKKTSSKSREVAFKAFPEDASPVPPTRD
jgi:hypothetical protein